jgi:hypothetical protein
MRKFHVLLVGALVAMAGTVAMAQIKGMGRINGRVTDDGGAPVDGVSIRLRQGTGLIEGKTDPKGDWALAGVARGNWMVTFEKQGFPTKFMKVTVEKELLRTDPIKVTMKKGA